MGKHTEELKILNVQQQIFWAKVKLVMCLVALCLSLVLLFKGGSWHWLLVGAFSIFTGYQQYSTMKIMSRTVG